MTLPTKLTFLGRGSRARTEFEAQKQTDAIRSKIDDIIAAMNNINTNVTAPSSVVINSISANGGTARTGNLTFTDTSTIKITNAANDFQWNPAFVTNGVTYSTAVGAGAVNSFMRSDSVLVYPEALATASDRTKTLTLTDSGTTSATLTPSSGFTAVGGRKVLALFAPGGTAQAIISPEGHIGAAGLDPGANSVLGFVKTFAAGAHSATTNGVNSQITDATATANPVVINAKLTLNPAGTPTLTTYGAVLGDVTKSTALNAADVARVFSGIFRNGTGTTPTASIYFSQGFTSGVGRTITNANHFDCQNVSISGTVNNQVGFAQLTAFSSGSTKRGMKIANSAECSANDFLCSTTAKGLICKDSQGTPEYWRFYIDSTGTKDATITIDSTGYVSATRAASATGNVTLNYQDTGTSAPTA